MILNVTPIHAIFYVFALMAVASAVMVITARHPVRSVLSLVLTFFSMAGIWMLLRAEFLSLILLLVYVGAVMTLFLFIVMMLSVEREEKRGGFVRYLPFGIALILLLTAMLGVTFFKGYTAAPVINDASQAANVSNLQALGEILYTDYAYPFEVAGTLLLSAMIAAIALVYRGPIKRKVQMADKQIGVTPKDAVRLVKMPSEPKVKG